MRVKPLFLIPIVAVALAACSTQATPKPQTTQAATEKPLFATDEEALAAAQAAYANYLEVSDQIARDGGANPERLKGLISAGLYKSQLDTYSTAASNGLKAVGSSTFNHFELQNRNSNTLTNYVCLDVSNIRVVDSANTDRTPVDRPNILPLELTWSEDSGVLILQTSDVWSGTNFCS
ncbi:hypothetical protein [Aurantimicrobium minutum]|uniref:hypothetical protein n=1 Tax=Aurantimicrobium minutum TaxID=708131 RepID=UPI002474E387|nr:hypothetical protein [Aurantimicrobium minutum]MDH6422318.1 hypothetical protein [Aurantimicrobium minutum]